MSETYQESMPVITSLQLRRPRVKAKCTARRFIKVPTTERIIPENVIYVKRLSLHSHLWPIGGNVACQYPV